MKQDAKSPLKFESHFIDIAGYKMHYLDEGEGDVVLLLHGNPTWCYYYRNVIDALKDNFRVIAPDHIGMGLSSRLPKGKYLTARDRISHLEEFLDKLGIDKFSTVMHDWGGPIGTGLMVGRPQKVQKIVYLNTTITETESLPPMIKKAASPLIGKLITCTTMRFLKWMTSYGVTKKLDKETCEGYYFPYKTRYEREAIWGFVKDIPFNENHVTYNETLKMATEVEKLQNIPTKIIWGLKDPCFHEGILEKVIKLFPKADVTEILDASHLVLDDAKDKVIQEIKDFFFNKLTKKEEVFQDKCVTKNPLVRNFINYAKNNKRQDAIIIPAFKRDFSISYTNTSYGKLLDKIYSYSRSFSEIGIGKNDKVIMLVMPGVEFLALSYAVMTVGATPIFLDSGMGIKNISKCVASIDAKAMICSPKAHILRFLKRSIFKNIKITITASNSILFRNSNLKFLQKLRPLEFNPVDNTDDIILMAFTSGATGTPKGVVFTSQMLEKQLKIFKEGLNFKEGEKDCPLLPVFSLFTISLGVTSVFPPVNPSRPITLDPVKIIKIINDLDIEFCFGAPSLWKKISEYAIRTKSSVNSLKGVFMAGAPVPSDVARNVKSIISSDGEIYTPYGATEALPATIISGKELLETERKKAKGGEQGVLVGKPAKDVQIRIIKYTKEEIKNIQDANILSSYEIGEVIVQGENISPAYFKRDDANAISKIKDVETFWHRMGDMGYLDDEGNLYFCGRKSEAVVCENQTFYTVSVEDVINCQQDVKRSALINYKGEPAVVIELEDYSLIKDKNYKDNLIKDLHKLAGEHRETSSIMTFFFEKSFPMDPRHNAKIRRDILARKYN